MLSERVSCKHPDVGSDRKLNTGLFAYPGTLEDLWPGEKTHRERTLLWAEP